MITIDTECDNAWARSREVTTENARFLPRFQQLCERFELKPTWLVNYEMAIDPFFQEFGRDVVARNTGEIGMHLHAWHSPPEHPLTDDDYVTHPYLVEYPREVIREKLTFMTRLLEDTFGVPMVSHRAGRWNFDEAYAQELIRLGYRVDCSVTPHQNWRTTPGGLPRSGGADYRRFPEAPYFVDPDCIAKAGDSELLEVPMTISPRHAWIRQMLPNWISGLPKVRSYVKKMSPLIWLRPDGRRSIEDLLWVVQTALDRGLPHLEFMLHSSEFMPGGSSTFPDNDSIERLYDQLESLFEFISTRASGRTLAEFHDEVQSRFVNGAGQALHDQAIVW